MISYMENDINKKKKVQSFIKKKWPEIYNKELELELYFICKSYIRKFEKNALRFNAVEIETINRCNNDCSFCPVSRNFEKREFRLMDKNLFLKIISELHEIGYSGQINLFSNNEPLLDKRIFEFAEIVRNQVPKAKINFYTNGILLDEYKFWQLIDNIDYMQIDNYSDSYEIQKNLQFLLPLFNSNTRINKKVNIVVMKKNQIRSTRGGESPNNLKSKTVKCSCVLPYQQMVIRPDGGVSLCCNDAYGQMTLGNVNDNSLIEIWNSDQYKKMREMIKQGRKNIKLCRYCDSYDKGRY